MMWKRVLLMCLFVAVGYATTAKQFANQLAAPVPIAGTGLVGTPVVGPDGGAVVVTCTNCSGGGGSSGLQDGGMVHAIVDSIPTHGVTGPMTDSEFRVSLAAVTPLPPATLPTHGVTGTFWQATQPISAASLPTHGVTLAASSITGGNPCQNPTATMLGKSVATSGTASVQLVALSGSTQIYVCSLNVTGVSGTTPKISITYGTGSACATGTVTLVGPVTTTANVNLYMGPVFAVTPAGQALCYVQTGTTPVSNLNLTYVQQ